MPAEGGSYEISPGGAAAELTGGEVDLVVTLRYFTDLHKILSADVRRAFAAADEAEKAERHEDSTHARRNAARALFAWIEAMVSGMKQAALRFDELHPGTHPFKPGELGLLREKETRLEKDGKVSERNRWLPATANLRFAFGAFERQFGTGYQLQASGPEWDAYLRAVKIRDRLMHPKRPEELTVTDDEYTHDLLVARVWFARVFGQAAASVLKGMRAQAKRLKIEIPPSLLSGVEYTQKRP